MSSIRSGDTIAAVATPAGSGGVGIIRISGPAALDIGATLVRRKAEDLPDRRLTLGVARGADGGRLDEVLVIAMRGPRSFTGEDVVEIHGHGGVANMSLLLRAVLAAGARAAEAGEFTRRAVENGRMDLPRAEALLSVIEASSERSLRIAQQQLGGAVGARVGVLRNRCVSLLARVEAAVDFPEDVDDVEWAELAEGVGGVQQDVLALVDSFELGRALLQGVLVALSGPTNSGKSSLFNRLIGSERALVSDAPGTTRDYVEATCVWDGVSVTLVDTAGERDFGSDVVEAKGFELGRRRAAEADLEVVLIPPGGELPLLGKRQLGVASKADLEASPAVEVAVSSTTGAGLPELRRAILAATVGEHREGEELVIVSERQRDDLARAARALAEARVGVGTRPAEIVAIDLRSACEALAGCLGEDLADAVLDDVFARFCIGK